MREQFERLDKVKDILENKFNGVVFNDDLNQYETPCYSTFIPEYVFELNFGWYAFQEQQKKIDSLLDKVCGTHEDFMNDQTRD